MSKTSNQPMWPIRKILPFSCALARGEGDAVMVAQVAQQHRRSRCPRACGSAVTTADESSSGEKSSSPIAFTPARAARPSRTCRSNAASRPCVEQQAERDVEAAQERDGRRERGVERVLRLLRRRPVEVEGPRGSRAGSSARAETEANARPGGHISAFCEPETDDVDSPGVGLERDGAERRDRVDDEQSPRRSPP